MTNQRADDGQSKNIRLSTRYNETVNCYISFIFLDYTRVYTPVLIDAPYLFIAYQHLYQFLKQYGATDNIYRYISNLYPERTRPKPNPNYFKDLAFANKQLTNKFMSNNVLEKVAKDINEEMAKAKNKLDSDRDFDIQCDVYDFSDRIQ